MEKIIKSRTDSFLENNHYISEWQFGFKQGISTKDGTTFLTNNIYKKNLTEVLQPYLYFWLNQGFRCTRGSWLYVKIEDKPCIVTYGVR